MAPTNSGSESPTEHLRFLCFHQTTLLGYRPTTAFLQPPTQLDVPLPDWASRPLTLPMPFEVDKFFHKNKDTHWAEREFQRRDLKGLFHSAYPRLFYQNLAVVKTEPDKLSTVINGVTAVTPRDIAAPLLSTRVVSG